jgi:hypothetical protein
VLVPLSAARYNAGMALGYSSPAGYVGVAPERVWTFIHEAIGVPPPLHNTGPSPEIFSRPLPYGTMSLAVGFDRATQRFVMARAPDARAYLAPCAQQVPTWRDAVRLVAAGHDVHRCALLEGGLGPAAPLASGTAVVSAFAPERVTVDVDAAGPALLVLGEAWYPGWQARVDGGRVEAVPVNAWMRAAPVPAGRHQVVFNFRSRLLAAGALVSALTALLAVICLRAPRRVHEAHAP